MTVVKHEHHGAVDVITINRPDKHNALNAEVRALLFATWRRFEESGQRVAILTGAGDRAFSAGADLTEVAATGMTIPPPGFLPILGDNVKVAKPVIAAVNGIAFAGGFLMAQMCDLCVASENATFAITEAKVGRGMPWAVPLTQLIPQRVMMEILMTGDPINAQRAQAIGFVNHVVPSAELLPFTLKLAQKIAANAPLTVAAAKEMIRLSNENGQTQALRLAHKVFEKVYQSDDATEGPRAFAEKRKPVFTGR
ncbi:MAG: enoyl-CoA hydratase-related protein [Alphaproteobacteria bacterium]|nr:enoyl-CoA hydratase-related protein [Alphaproteobacteria bacterium]